MRACGYTRPGERGGARPTVPAVRLRHHARLVSAGHRRPAPVSGARAERGGGSRMV